MKKFQWRIKSARLTCPTCKSKVVMEFVGRWRIHSAGSAKEGKGVVEGNADREDGVGGVDDSGGECPFARDDSDG